MESEATRWINSQPYLVATEYNPDTREADLFARKMSDPPLVLSLIAGDFAHNLRAALDYLVYQLADLGNEPRGNKTQFPIFEKVADYNRWEPVYLKGVPEPHRATIRSLQPFDRPNHLLFEIMDLDDHDKHRFADVVTTAAYATKLEPVYGKIEATKFPPGVPFYLNDRAYLGSWRGIPDEKGQMRVHAEVVPALLFRVVTTTASREIMALNFNRMVSMVTDYLSEFADAFDPAPAHERPPSNT